MSPASGSGVSPEGFQPPLIRVEGLSKTYGDGTPVLRDVTLSFDRGAFVVILGQSGAGKSTFLRCLNRLIEPTAGSVWVPRDAFGPGTGEVDLLRMAPSELRMWRRKVGMVFQQFNLAKRLSVLDNVLSGALGYQPAVAGALRRFPREVREEAARNLARVGLVAQARQRADTLSGGQQQRVAIARALMQRPAVILADEPVASLDPTLAETILELLQRIAREDGITVVVSLHALDLARRYGDRLIGFAGGRVAFDGPTGALDDEAIRKLYARSEVADGVPA